MKLRLDANLMLSMFVVLVVFQLALPLIGLVTAPISSALTELFNK